jgi:hypothetical protein
MTLFLIPANLWLVQRIRYSGARNDPSRNIIGIP